MKRLQHFVFLAEELNFTRAADRANLSQTAFSRSIQVLEAACAVSLFDRGTRSVQLTAVGQQLLAKARPLLAQSRDLIREVDGIADAQGGELSFGASQMTIDSVVSGSLLTLMQRSPRLQVNIEVSHWRLLQQHLEQERIEFFVSYPGLLQHDLDFVVTPLQSVPSSVFCRPQHPLLARSDPPLPEELSRYPWASVQLRERGVKGRVVRCHRRHDGLAGGGQRDGRRAEAAAQHRRERVALLTVGGMKLVAAREHRTTGAEKPPEKAV